MALADGKVCWVLSVIQLYLSILPRMMSHRSKVLLSLSDFLNLCLLAPLCRYSSMFKVALVMWVLGINPS